MRKDMQST